MKRPASQKYLPLISLSVILSCTTLKKNTDEAVHSKNEMEVWILSGHLKDNDTGDSYALSYFILHFYEEDASRPDKYFAYYALTDLASKKFVSDISANISLAEEQELHLPLRFSFYKSYNESKLKGRSGRYLLKASVANEQNYTIKLRTSTKQSSYRPGYSHKKEFFFANMFSYNNITAKGKITLGKKKIPVTGILNFDRLWDCRQLFAREVTKVAVQLNSQNELLNIWKVSIAKDSSVVFGEFFPSGKNPVPLEGKDIKFTELETWTSDSTGVKFPVRFDLDIPAWGKHFEMRASALNQEIITAGSRTYDGSFTVYQKTNDTLAEAGKAVIIMTRHK